VGETLAGKGRNEAAGAVGTHTDVALDEPRYIINVEATGEVRDKDGNLLSSTPVTGQSIPLTGAQLQELGIPIPEEQE
jgi:hypothetical protein